MKPLYLERHESDKNLHRFYQLHVTPGIFGDWALVREWGRVGSPGTMRKDWFVSEKDAINAKQKLCKAKQKKKLSTQGGDKTEDQTVLIQAIQVYCTYIINILAFIPLSLVELFYNLRSVYFY